MKFAPSEKAQLVRTEAEFIGLKAYLLAAGAHAGQKRKDGIEPYINHPRRVAATVLSFMWDEDYNDIRNCVYAAFLHDTIEDTEVTQEDLSSYFNPTVVEYVVWLTNEPKSSGNRKTRFELNNKRLSRAPIGPVIIKLADILDNTSDMEKLAMSQGQEYIKMYAKEKKETLDVLARDEIKDKSLYEAIERNLKDFL